MPEYFLHQAGVTRDDFAGQPGFSGSHDATINLVESGTYEAGALNMQVWETRTQEGEIDSSQVRAVFTTPTYHDYHWIAGPTVEERFGDGFSERIRTAMLELSTDDPAQAELLEQYGAESFIETEADNYAEVEEIARELGLLS